MGNDPTGRNHGRAADGGDPAMNADSVREHERGRDNMERKRTNGYGELELPLPVLIPTPSNRRGSAAYHRGSIARAEVPHRGGSTAQPGGSKKLLPRGNGSTVPPQAVVPWQAAVVPQLAAVVP